VAKFDASISWYWPTAFPAEKDLCRWIEQGAKIISSISAYFGLTTAHDFRFPNADGLDLHA